MTDVRIVTDYNMSNTIDITNNKYLFQIIKALDDNKIKYNIIYKSKMGNMGHEFIKIQFESPDEAVQFKMEYL